MQHSVSCTTLKCLFTLLFVSFLTLPANSRKVKEYNLENPQVKAYYDQVKYDVNNYDVSYIKKYEVKTDFRRDQPNPVTLNWTSNRLSEKLHLIVARDKALSQVVMQKDINGYTSAYNIWNLIPGRTYYYRLSDNQGVIQQGAFKTTGCRRMIRANSIHNVRDMGGLKTTDNRRIAYGKIYRGGQLSYKGSGQDSAKVITQINEEDIRLLHDVLNIRGEFDLRYDSELGYNDGIEGNDIVTSPLGSDVDYYNIQVGQSGRIEKLPRYGEVLKNMLKYLRRGQSVYIHCVAGADRTGAMCWLLAGLAGVPENDVIMDYELTTFSIYGLRTRNNGDIKHGIPYVKALQGNTFQEKCQTLFLSQGVTMDEIEEFKRLVLEKD